MAGSWQLALDWQLLCSSICQFPRCCTLSSFHMRKVSANCLLTCRPSGQIHICTSTLSCNCMPIPHPLPYPPGKFVYLELFDNSIHHFFQCAFHPSWLSEEDIYFGFYLGEGGVSLFLCYVLFFKLIWVIYYILLCVMLYILLSPWDWNRLQLLCNKCTHTRTKLNHQSAHICIVKITVYHHIINMNANVLL